MSPPILLLIAVFAAVAVAGGYVGVSLLDAASQSQVRLAAARENLDSLLRIQYGAEAGLRGYLATGERSFLELQAAPGDSFSARADRLDGELRNAHLFAARDGAARLHAFHTQWERDVEGPLLTDPHRPDALVLQTRGKTLTDAIRDRATYVRGQLKLADTAVASELRWRIDATVAVCVGTITLFAIAALTLGLSRAAAMEALVREHSLVTALQRTLRVDGAGLPRTAVGFAYTSATREALVGGDLIDTWRSGNDRGWFLIADVSGKGVRAARHSAFVQYAVRTLTAQTGDPAEVLARFNALFLDTFDDPSVFVVAFLGAFDARSGELRYASAGHNIAFIARAQGIEQLAPTGAIIGLSASEPYEQRSVQLVTGDTVVLATDGLTESRDAAGDMLGDEGVIALLGAQSGEPQAICDRLVREAERRSEGYVKDDMAILVLRILDAGVAGTATVFSTMTS